MHLLLGALLIVSCGTWPIKSQQFTPHSRHCRNFQKSQEFPIPRCQANYWFFTCLYRYKCDENGEVEFSDCRKWDSNFEYPDCKDVYCSTARGDGKDTNQTTEKGNTLDEDVGLDG